MFGSREILTSAQIRAVERWAMDSGIASGLELMERAGAAVAGEIRLRWPKPARACVMCGPGNNGGDGYVVARLLNEAGWQVRVLGMDNTPPPDAAVMKRRWLEIGPVEALNEGVLRRKSADVYVDAISGTGLTRPLEGELLETVGYLGGSGGDWGFFSKRLVAIDGPSGLCLDSGRMLGGSADTLFSPRAALTVTFDSPRVGHVLAQGPELCGELVVADIGLNWPRMGRNPPLHPGQVTRVSGPSFARESHDLFAIRPEDLAKLSDGHKFSHGHALVVAGGAGQGGAARLSARAALRVGAGLVTIAPPQDALIEHALPPDALMRRAVDTADDLARRLEDRRITAVLLGPGCGVERAKALLPALLETRRPCVLDADALTALSQRKAPLEGLHSHLVLTPHMGEFARIFPDIAAKLAGPQPPFDQHTLGQVKGEEMARMLAQDAEYRAALAAERGPLYSKLDAVRDAARRAGCVILLKGPDTVIADANGTVHVHAASYDAAAPWLATAGSGDVLAGIIAGLMARGWPAFRAATLGAALHAAAARSFGPGLIADDLPDQLPAVFRGLGL
ncbi:NAD(P)H-hydrate epimerase [Paracoccus sulfuroxidans]|nr:NAD(P)H-hydrate epimerase [Paracoccus sulfuroxidans]